MDIRNIISHRLFRVGCGCAAALAAVFTTGCSDFLEVEPQDYIILENFWTEKTDVENIVAGCYSRMQSADVVKRMMVWGEFRSENIGVGNNIDKDQDLEKVLKENIDAKNSYTGWSGFYSVINRCNTVIKYAPLVAAKDQAYTESELKAHVAEVTALRSLCYFYLIRAFRDVPYSTEAFIDDNQTMDLPATPFNAVLDSLIYSLESVKGDAVERYPTTQPLYQTGRITKESINAILCELYLWKQDWDNCIKYADMVIASKKLIAEENLAQSYSSSSNSSLYERTNGYPLINANITGSYYGNTYDKLFSSDNTTNSQEIVFQLVYDDNPRGNSMLANWAVNDFYGNSTAIKGYAAPSTYLIEDIGKTSSRTIFADANKKSDARMFENCYIGLSSICKYVWQGVTIDATNSSSPKIAYSSVWTEKYNGSNWIIYRLSDIMLMKAEALTMKAQEGSTEEIVQGNKQYLDEAFTLVNAVNKRSICQTVLTDTLVRSSFNTKNQMEELVFQERQRELMFEGKRWFDLVRRTQRDGNTKVLSNAALRKVTTGGALIANKLTKIDAIYWPYNYDEMKVNKNLVQNPAFSSGEDKNYEKNY